MIMRMKYAKPHVFRDEAYVTGQYQHKRTSKYMPHQGKRERMRRMGKMVIKLNTNA